MPLPPLRASQIQGDHVEQIGQNIVTLGFEFSTQSVQAPPPTNNFDLITMVFHVVQLERIFVTGLNNIEIKLLRDPNGTLMWQNMEMRTAVPTSPSDQAKQAEEK